MIETYRSVIRFLSCLYVNNELVQPLLVDTVYEHNEGAQEIFVPYARLFIPLMNFSGKTVLTEHPDFSEFRLELGRQCWEPRASRCSGRLLGVLPFGPIPFRPMS